MFLTLWVTLSQGWGSIYYRHYTVSVCYQPDPSFRQNAGEFKAGRIPFRDKERDTEPDWQGLTERRKFISQLEREVHQSQQSKGQSPSRRSQALVYCTSSSYDLVQDEYHLGALDKSNPHPRYPHSTPIPSSSTSSWYTFARNVFMNAKTPAAVSLSKTWKLHFPQDERQETHERTHRIRSSDPISQRHALTEPTASRPLHTQLCVGPSTQQNEMSPPHPHPPVCVDQTSVTVHADSAFLHWPSFQSFHSSLLTAGPRGTCHDPSQNIILKKGWCHCLLGLCFSPADKLCLQAIPLFE